MTDVPDPIAIVQARMDELHEARERRDAQLLAACRSRDQWLDDCWRARNELAIAMRRIEVLERVTDALSDALLFGEKT